MWNTSWRDGLTQPVLISFPHSRDVFLYNLGQSQIIARQAITCLISLMKRVIKGIFFLKS